MAVEKDGHKLLMSIVGDTLIEVRISTHSKVSVTKYERNNYIVSSYRDVIVITTFATKRASKAQSIDMY